MSCLELQSIEAQLVAIKKYARESQRPNQATIDEQVARELALAEGARAELQSVLKAIEAERLNVGVNDYASRTDDRIRQRYEEAIKAEAIWLGKHGHGVPVRYVTRVNALESTVDAFVVKVRALVDGRIDGIMKQLRREKGNVRGYDQQLAGHQRLLQL